MWTYFIPEDKSTWPIIGKQYLTIPHYHGGIALQIFTGEYFDHGEYANTLDEIKYWMNPKDIMPKE